MNRQEKAKNGIAALSKNVRNFAFSEKLVQLPENFVPGPTDVICARGKTAFSHPGNHRYRMIIESNLQKYSEALHKATKTRIVSSIVESIRGASPSRVGFVKCKGGRWYKVGDHVAREKVGQSFRDLLHTKYRSSNKAKKRRQKEVKNNLGIEQESIESNSTPLQEGSHGVSITKNISENPHCLSLPLSTTNSPLESNTEIVVEMNDSNERICGISKENGLQPTRYVIDFIPQSMESDRRLSESIESISYMEADVATNSLWDGKDGSGLFD